MKYIKHNQADDYEDKGIARKNAGGLSIVPALRRGNSACNAPALRDAGASDTAFPRRSAGTINNQLNRMQRAFLAIGLVVISGCAEWSSTPARVQDDFGSSVRNMVLQQTYNPAKAQSPSALAPAGMDGNKANSVLENTYRGLIVKPEQRLTHPTIYGIDGRGSGISTSGGSNR